MFLVKNQIKKGSEVKGFIIQADDLTVVVTERGLFFETWFHAAIESGYQFYGYSASQIASPNGTPLTELPVVDYDDISELQWVEAEDFAMAAMSDAECCRFYSERRVISHILPEGDEITIHTREEFINYLNKCRVQILKNGYCTDHRPVNAFVAREALLTFDEFYQNRDLLEYLGIMADRRKFRTYKEYTDLVEWLYRKGVLNTHTPTPIEFITAYNTWGFDGIGDDCISTQTKLGVDGYLHLANEDAALADAFQNRTRTWVIWDKDENISYLDDTVNTADVIRFNRERIIFGSEDELFEHRRYNKWNCKYYATKALVSDVSDRMYLNFISKEGYPFSVRFAHNAVAVFSGTQNIYYGKGFSISSAIKGTSFTLENIRSEDDYYIWNLAHCRVADLIRKSTMTAPIESTYDMLIKDGLSPRSALAWMSRMIKFGTQDSCKQLKDSLDAAPDYAGAFDFYNSPLDPAVCKTFKINSDLIESKTDFLDAAGAELEEVILSMGSDRSLSGKNQDRVMAVQIYDKIKFVHDAVNNQFNLGAYGDGIIKDFRDSIDVYVNLLMTVVKKECGGQMNKALAEDIINNFEEGGYIDIKDVFRPRDNAYKGYIEDLAELRRVRAHGAWAWLYCTKIYREDSNAPTDEQRPFLMEVITCTNKKLREALSNAIIENTPVSFTAREASFVRAQADWVAAKLFYAILGGGINESTKTDKGYPVKVAGVGFEPFEAVIPVNVYAAVRAYDFRENTAYITLYDYCKFELGANGAFSLFLVNADVTPWSVTPKQGYSIPTYGYFVNYYREDALQAFGNEYMTALVTTKSRVGMPISLIPQTKYIPDNYTDTVDMYDQYTINAVLDERLDETAALYHQRWIWTRMEARANGLVLKTIPLKQDVVWNSFAQLMGYEFSTEPTYFTADELDAGQADTNCAYNMDIQRLTFGVEKNVNLLSAEITTINGFILPNYDFDKMRTWYRLLSGKFKTEAPIYKTASGLLFLSAEGSKFVACTNLNRAVLEQLASQGIMFKLDNDSFLVGALNGDFVLEVK